MHGYTSRTYRGTTTLCLSICHYRVTSYPHAFLKKRRGYCNRLGPSVCPSVCPSRYLLLNRWTKFNQIWCVSCSHGKGVQQHIFFGPAPWGPGEGPKGQILLNIIRFQLQSQFQRFFNQTLCVFSHMKDLKHIRRDFHSLVWVMPQGSDLGVLWGVEWSKKIFFPKFNQIWCVSNLHQIDNGTCNSTIFLVPTP